MDVLRKSLYVVWLWVRMRVGGGCVGRGTLGSRMERKRLGGRTRAVRNQPFMSDFWMDVEIIENKLQLQCPVISVNNVMFLRSGL